MNIKFEVTDIAAEDVSKVLREVKQELFAPLTPSPIELLLQAYLQRQEPPQGYVPPQPSALHLAPPTAPQVSSAPPQFNPAQAFGAAGMRQLSPTPEPSTELPVTVEQSPESEPTQLAAGSTGKTWLQHLLFFDPFQNNLLFLAVMAAIVLGGYCGFSRQSPLTVLRLQPAEPLTTPTPSSTKPSH